jgi:hypothetical protein
MITIHYRDNIMRLFVEIFSIFPCKIQSVFLFSSTAHVLIYEKFLDLLLKSVITTNGSLESLIRDVEMLPQMVNVVK